MTTVVKTRALIVAVVGSASAALALAAMQMPLHEVRTLALLAAAAAASERFTIPADASSLHPLDAHGFSFSVAVHIAAILILGPWAAAIIAAFGVVAADSYARAPAERVAYNASVFALGAVSGGLVFQALGGTPGQLGLPSDFVPLAGLVVATYAVNTLCIGAIVAATRGTALWSLQLQKLRAELPTNAAEASLGVVVALFVLYDAWALVAIVPLGIAVYLSRARLATLRRETGHALETFANIVDERDPYTYRHSARVAEHIRRLASALGLASTEVATLRWAGRLHDLGKISVDASVLRKDEPLDEDEWSAMRLHPRLSARLLRRFRFAAREAQAVEYHHERVDGHGYYGVDAREIPLAAHFIIVADSFDAMTTDRPYRRALRKDQALEEIEAKLGTQFHPAVGKAFVALQRGENPIGVLSAAERAELRHLGTRGPRDSRSPIRAVRERPDLVGLTGVVAALSVLGFGGGVFATIPLALGLLATFVFVIGLWRAERLGAELEAIAGSEPGAVPKFDRLVARLVEASDLRWAALVRWGDGDVTPGLERLWNGGPHVPTESALTSWLIREAETRAELISASGSELGCPGAYAAVPLRRDGAPAGFLALGFGRISPPHVRLGLVQAAPRLAEALLEAGPARNAERRRLAVAS